MAHVYDVMLHEPQLTCTVWWFEIPHRVDGIHLPFRVSTTSRLRTWLKSVVYALLNYPSVYVVRWKCNGAHLCGMEVCVPAFDDWHLTWTPELSFRWLSTLMRRIAEPPSRLGRTADRAHFAPVCVADIALRVPQQFPFWNLLATYFGARNPADWSIVTNNLQRDNAWIRYSHVRGVQLRFAHAAWTLFCRSGHLGGTWFDYSRWLNMPYTVRWHRNEYGTGFPEAVYSTEELLQFHPDHPTRNADEAAVEAASAIAALDNLPRSLSPEAAGDEGAAAEAAAAGATGAGGPPLLPAPPAENPNHYEHQPPSQLPMFIPFAQSDLSLPGSSSTSASTCAPASIPAQAPIPAQTPVVLASVPASSGIGSSRPPWAAPFIRSRNRTSAYVSIVSTAGTRIHAPPRLRKRAPAFRASLNPHCDRILTPHTIAASIASARDGHFVCMPSDMSILSPHDPPCAPSMLLQQAAPADGGRNMTTEDMAEERARLDSMARFSFMQQSIEYAAAAATPCA